MPKDIAKVYAAELEGIEAKLIEVEVDLNVGIHAFNIVGLADKALNEARERVSAALKNIGIKPPNKENRRITVNLAPADVRKGGSNYDLAIAIGYLLASGQISSFDARNKMFVGELALDGGLRPICGALNIAEMARDNGFATLFVPRVNANEAAAIDGIEVVPVGDIGELIEILEGAKKVSRSIFSPKKENSMVTNDFSEIKGQENVKRALTLAAAGGHNILMVGSPGVGKSFLARALGGIMPDLSLREAIEVTKIWSAAGFSLRDLVRHPPFRAPHQTASVAALVGGGSNPRPGEISLAHRGTLFLDELLEFSSVALEALRQPMESGVIHIARARRSLIFPAKFILVAATNPCPCGYYGDSDRECKCSAHEIIKYQKKISGPLLDRIDIQVKVHNVRLEELQKSGPTANQNPVLKEEVLRTRQIQGRRFVGLTALTNAEMSSRETEQLVRLDIKAISFLATLNKSGLSPRAYYKVLRVARTIADLEESEKVGVDHLAEAYSYRLREGDW